MEADITQMALSDKEIREPDSDHVAGSQRSFGRLFVGDMIRLAPGLLAQFLGGFGVSIVLGMYLPPEGMGLYTLFWLAQAYATNLTTGWLQNAIVRLLPEDPSHLKRFMRFSFVLVLAVGALGMLIAIILGGGWPEEFHWSHLAWTVAILCSTSIFSIFQVMLRGLFEQNRFSASTVLLVVTKIVLLLVLLPNASDRVMRTLMAMAISPMPALVWQWEKLRKMDQQRTCQDMGKSIDGSLLRRSFVYGMPLTISLFIISLLQTGDRYLLATLVSLKELGLYAFWMNIGLQVGQRLYRVIFMALNPRLFQLHRADPSRAKRHVRRFTGLYVLIAAPLLTLLGLLLPPVLIWLKINPQYAPASHLIFYGMGMAFFLGLTQLCGKEREFAERTTVFMQAAVLGVLMMVAGVYVLTPLAGLDGAAMGTLAGFGLYFLVVAFAARTWPPVADLLTGVLSSLAMFAVYQGAAYAFGSLAGMLALGLLFTFYGLWTIRRAWRNRLQKAV